ncbi:amino acid permease/ SLC12A domain-containing protein [Mycotypha africana]|uniref:amino acid permease/ SLC12A domain-containing protein n=1 Tax=Mycotypha africana TaxID=64632 RepID=UPI0023018331|nr:amino acid permease/ SLC12A domain-containing protein [Mycotypha africana]KAI8979292.1 amino acid permease/ SLC12A domain-containing protein [Mycotypha africana]
MLLNKASKEFQQPESAGNYYHESQEIQDHEKASPPSYISQNLNEEEANELQSGTVRGLTARHIQMISLGGAIGTGLFLNSGSNIAEAGPAGALIAYCVYCIMTCLGEMATFMPVSGSFNHYATRFVDPSLGFALDLAVTISTELAAAATIIKYWKEVMPDAAWSIIFLVLMIAINFLGVRIYGEMEYWFALIKILIVIVFVIIAILATAGAIGGHTIGFEYWKNPGAFNNGAVGTVSVLLSAGFSFQGTEIVGITAGEAKNPTKTVPRAIRNTFWRILIFYVLTIFLIGMCLPFNNEDLQNGDGGPGTASFTLVFKVAGIEAGAHVINAVVLTSVLSACNSSMYTTSRTLLGLSRDNNAPAFLGRVNRFGAPFWAVLFSSITGFACVFVSIYSAEEAFIWFLSITAVTGFISWAGIAGIHIRFRRAYIRQGRSIDELPYKAMGYPFSGLFACILCILIILGQGYKAFTPEFKPITFVTNYIGIVPFVLCYVIHKLWTKSKVVPLEEVDFETGRVTRLDIEKDNEEDKHIPRWKKVLAWII